MNSKKDTVSGFGNNSNKFLGHKLRIQPNFNKKYYDDQKCEFNSVIHFLKSVKIQLYKGP